MKRRTFLTSAASMGGALLTLPFGRHAWGVVGENPGKRLVVIFLRGAVDGLNVVVPHGDDAYYSARRSIAVPRGPGGVLDLDGHFGLHPSLAAVLPLWNQKSLAFVHASGSPDPSRSHFDAQAMMEAGTPGRPANREGWLNRLLATLPVPHLPSQAVSVGPTVPLILAGPIRVANVTIGKNLTKPTALDCPAVNSAFGQLYDGNDEMSTAYRDGREARQQLLSNMDKEMAEADNGAPSADGFPAQAKQLAAMIRRDPRIKVAFAALGGWDTHVNQGGVKGQLAGRLQPLAEGLSAFATGLGQEYQNTVVLVISEFGRTVRENGNGGTDHGHGNVMWVMGGPVNGGMVYGEWPGLTPNRLFEGRDLAITTDFRTVVGGVVERHLRLSDKDLRTVFPEMPPNKSGVSGIL